ncbi:hypothetical protein KAR91_33810 [Candidatus Pacearchaeota archaeon]|nr:hypothetical protein [Candidatus Pacearchaeota archaeon]
MVTDIRLSICFKNHRKRRKFKRKVGPEGTDYLIDLWLTVAQQRPKGILYGFEEEDIADAAGYTGNAEFFVLSLVECGFLETTREGTYALHDWKKYQNWAVNSEERSAIATKAAHARWKKKKVDIPDG